MIPEKNHCFDFDGLFSIVSKSLASGLINRFHLFSYLFISISNSRDRLGVPQEACLSDTPVTTSARHISLRNQNAKDFLPEG